MAFKRLIGEDGALFRGTLGATVTGDGSTQSIAAETLVQVTSSLTANIGSAFEGLPAGYFYYSPIATLAADLIVGTTWKVMTVGNMLDVAGWMLEASADIVETTVLNDNFKKKRTAKLDATGSVDLVFIKGITDVAGSGILDSFYDVVAIAADGTATLSPKTSESIWLMGWLDNKDSETGENLLFTVMEVEFENFPLNVKMGEPDGFTANFHLVGATDPVIYKVAII